MSKEEALGEIDRELERDKAYLNVLDTFQDRSKTKERYYYRARIQLLEKLKDKLLGSGPD